MQPVRQNVEGQTARRGPSTLLVTRRAGLDGQSRRGPERAERAVVLARAERQSRLPGRARSGNRFGRCRSRRRALGGRGRVVEGMERVDRIKRGDSNQNGMVTDPDRIERMIVAADAP